jgi:activating signal cointegrator complex subunit 3
VKLTVYPRFRWNDRIHGGSEPFWIWVEDPVNNHIYHYEYFLLAKKQVMSKSDQEIVFTIPIFEPLPTQYYVRAISDRWIGSETYCTISFQHLILPEKHPPHTNLLDLQPLPVSALDNAQLQSLYTFGHFNPIQTQIFHTLYYTDKNVLLGAPTGSGKTIAAEIAMFKVFRDYPDGKVVYIAPMKALVRERIQDWKVRLQEKIGKSVVELTGDVTPDMRSIIKASVIVTTPEKWDAVSRSWQTRSFVQAVRLIVIDEIHLLGQDRGPVLEAIVTRTNFISSHTSNKLRVVGLSTALANAKDLADWLGIENQTGLFNFRPSVRPVPLEVHISGYPGKHYCPRMASMNKPTYQAIQQHSPTKPTLIFVSSRRQTRLTALDLIAFLAGEDNPKMWLNIEESALERLSLKDQNLRLTLAFGIGMHHAGLVERDRKTVEELFVNQKIQVLIATATVAWGVNFPAHLVVIKGTEYYDGKLKRYVDMPITDVLQMMGRAGRPQFDDHGVACVLVHDLKKHFYKKFLYEPFPVESSLHDVLPDHLNAEIVAGTITSKQEALDYMTWTYFFRRLVQNPSYYGLDGVDETNINVYMTGIVEKSLGTLQKSFCIDYDENDVGLVSTTLGRIASYYYLTHLTVQHFRHNLRPNMSRYEVMEVLCDATEYDQLPVRHNEEIMNADLAKMCPLDTSARSMESANTKTLLLLQAHFSRLNLPCSDYYTDTKSVLDQAIRILQAMIDVAAESGWLSTTLQIQNIMQMIIQARWTNESSILILPHVEPHMMYLFKAKMLTCIPELWQLCRGKCEPLAKILRPEMDESLIDDVFEALKRLPQLRVDLRLAFSDKPPLLLQTNTRAEASWITVDADVECTLIINMSRLNRLGRDEKAFAPKFPKQQDESWFLVLGNVEDNQDMVALKRVKTIRGPTTQQMTFYTPEKRGRVIMTLYIMSDSYLGLDQQYDIHLEVVEQKNKLNSVSAVTM